MAQTPNVPLSALQAAIDYTFKDKALLALALTHSSTVRQAGGEDNERLEFLGDRVLGLVIAQFLYIDDPAGGEGDLAHRYNELVRKETCTEIARTLKLGDYLQLSRGEIKSGGRDKNSLLGDACEAVIGAVFLDAGFAAARDVVIGLWGERLATSAEAARDAKTALQEWAQARRLPPPTYQLISRTGPDHAPEFTMAAHLPDHQSCQGRGPGKRQAEQAAAAALLAALSDASDTDTSDV
jgi:ribonuclease-3